MQAKQYLSFNIWGFEGLEYNVRTNIAATLYSKPSNPQILKPKYCLATFD